MGITTTQNISQPAAQPSSSMDVAKKLKLQKAVREFEALFVSYMLKAMRESVQKRDIDGETFGGDLFDDMFNVEVAKAMAKQGSFGIAEMLYRKMTGESLSDASFDTNAFLQLRASKIRFARVPQKTTETSGIQPSLADRVNRFQAAIDAVAQKHGIDSTLIKAVIATESAGNPRAMSSKNAKGLMQLLDSTAAEMGVENVWDPKQNIEGGTKYLRQLLEQFDGNVALALASYNAGPKRVLKYKGIPPIQETQSYVSRVLQLWKHFQQQEGIKDEE